MRDGDRAGKMNRVLFLLGIISIFKAIEGRPELSVKNEIMKLSNELVGPVLANTKKANEMLSEMRQAYSERMFNKRSGLFNTVGDGESNAVAFLKAAPVPDLCKDLSAAVESAQKITNQAALLALQISADFTDIVITSSDCITINIFKAASCSAHKMRDARDTYSKYRPQLIDVNRKLLDKLQIVAKDFVACFKRVQS